MISWRKSYRPLNKVLISESALKKNLALFRSLNPNKEICPVLKSNAYGHGLLTVAKLLDKENCAFFVVDSLYEAYELRKARIRTPILVLGFNFAENLKKRLPFHFAASDLESLKRLLGLDLPFHLELDTGMRRMGIEPHEWQKAADLIQKKSQLFKGIFTHLMTADHEDDFHLKEQEKIFSVGFRFFEKRGLSPKWVHIGNSAGVGRIQVEGVNMARVGLGLYGINPYPSGHPQFESLEGLEPVMSVESTVVALHVLKKGEVLSYGASYKAERDMQVGVAPFGYHEGMPIGLSNKGFILCKGRPCRILGRINMNHCFFDASGLDMKLGDPIQIYSAKKTDENGVRQMAALAETIAYELLVRVSPTIRRIIHCEPDFIRDIKLRTGVN